MPIGDVQGYSFDRRDRQGTGGRGEAHAVVAGFSDGLDASFGPDRLGNVANRQTEAGQGFWAHLDGNLG